jgi:hypothetical protein
MLWCAGSEAVTRPLPLRLEDRGGVRGRVSEVVVHNVRSAAGSGVRLEVTEADDAYWRSPSSSSSSLSLDE